VFGKNLPLIGARKNPLTTTKKGRVKRGVFLQITDNKGREHSWEGGKGWGKGKPFCFAKRNIFDDNRKIGVR